MGFNIQWRDMVQRDINEFKELKEQVIRSAEECYRYRIDIKHYRDSPQGKSDSEVPQYMINNLEQMEEERINHDRLYELFEVNELKMLLAFIKYLELPFPIDNEYELDIITTGEKVPIVFSYEKTNENITCLWDTNHKITKVSRGYDADNIDRMDIFLKGIDTLRPDVLALELTSDNGQRIVDGYMSDDISEEDARIGLFWDHASVGPYDDYTRILKFAKENGIKVKAVDMVTKDYKDTYNLSTFQQSSDLTDYEKQDEISKVKTRFIKGQLDEIVTYGDKVLLIVGVGHRPNLLELMG